MTKFSVGVEEDGEGPSNRVPKRQRAERVLDIEGEGSGQEESDQDDEQEESDQDEEEASQGEGEEEEEEEASEESQGEEELEEPMNPHTTTRDGSVSITLTDPEVLDCTICYDALTIPVYQCENGHIACSTCCIKIRNKCPSCATPIGYSRCRAIEKVLESIKVSCHNTKYGCKETFSYSMKQKHEKACPFVACSCPFPGCCFEGSSENLCVHFSNVHKYFATCFHHDRLAPITLQVSEKFLILREETYGSLFLLHNKVETLGNVVTLSRIGPSAERSYFYELIVKAPSDGSTLKLQSFTKSTPKWVDSPQSLGFLLVPNQFSSISQQIKIDLRVWHSDRFSFIPRPSGA